ncbi:MAG TPA: alpha/beta fold hydrolase [Burkholderiales bacterium]|jgi:pimeloyl-ACP methyl ester carboxylesterase|nr:alpha/beta fold hydrolase [Burkholderiales bacterium]
MSRTIRRVVLALAAAAAGIYATGAALLWRSPDRFMDFPEPEAPHSPGMLGIDYREVWLRAGPNRALVHGWWLPNGRDAPAVLVLPGTGRSKAGMVHTAAAIHAAGAAVLMIDYRGLGRSDRGPLTESSMYEDAEAAWHELRWHQPDAGRRFVYGHSLGAAPALELAARYPDVSGVAIEGAPTSMRELLRGSWVEALYPVDAILAGRFDPAGKLRRLSAPILVIHGKRDKLVPPAMGVELYMRATGRKSLLLVEEAAHSDAAAVGTREYQGAVEQLLGPGVNRALAALTRRAAPSRAG